MPTSAHFSPLCAEFVRLSPVACRLLQGGQGEGPGGVSVGSGGQSFNPVGGRAGVSRISRPGPVRR